MRVLLVVVAALVAVPAAFAHAEITPATAKVGQTTVLHLTVPCESETAATVAVRVTAPSGVELTGRTSWTGRSRNVVKLSFTARAEKAGDYPLHVRQTYSDGRVVDWSGPESSNTPAPVLHVSATQNNGRDRIIISIAIVAVVGAWLALRGRGKRA